LTVISENTASTTIAESEANHETSV